MHFLYIGLGSSMLQGRIWLRALPHFLQLCWGFGFLLASKHTGRQVPESSASGSDWCLVLTKCWPWISLICVFREASVKWFLPQKMQLCHSGGSNTWIDSIWLSSSFSVLLSFSHCRQLYIFRLSSDSVCGWRIDWDGASRQVSVWGPSWDSWDKQTTKRTSQLLDQLGPEGPVGENSKPKNHPNLSKFLPFSS